MRRAHLLALLGCMLRLSPVGAQNPAPSAPAQNEAQLKGAIWTATAEQAWQDLRLPGSKKPKRWNTLDNFKNWREQHAKNDLAGLIGLHDKVQRFVKQKPVSPTELKAAILHEIGSLNHEGRHVDEKKLDEALKKVASSAKVGKSVSPKLNSVAKDEGSAPRAGNASADVPAATAQTIKTKSNTTTEAAPDPFGNENQPPPPLHEKQQMPAKGHFWRWVLLASTLGTGAGWLAARLTRKEQPADATDPTPAHTGKKQSTKPTENEGWYKQQNQALTQQKRALEAQVFDLNRTNSALQEEVLALRQPPTGRIAVGPESSEPPTSSHPATPPDSRAKFYTSAAPGGILEHDKLATQSMGRMALLVEPNGQNPHNARFTLNPDVDKSWLIAADLEKLRDYFTFTLPADRWPSSVEATAPGTLTREGNGWKVEKKATLTVR